MVISIYVSRFAADIAAAVVAAPRETVFITSANLTEAALDRNIELGVLVYGRAFALAVVGYFRGLIDHDLLKPLPLARQKSHHLLTVDH
jgi:phosphatidylserine/phosphatidylglycerophosphate/cardiolipin synthase-like enzyme